MDKRTRGFKQLIGQTIVKVDARCLNAVFLTCEDGTRFMLDISMVPLGGDVNNQVGRLTCYKEQFVPLPKPPGPHIKK